MGFNWLNSDHHQIFEFEISDRFSNSYSVCNHFAHFAHFLLLDLSSIGDVDNNLQSCMGNNKSQQTEIVEEMTSRNLNKRDSDVQIQTALEFLKIPEAVNVDRQSKQSYLVRKGISPANIDRAFKIMGKIETGKAEEVYSKVEETFIREKLQNSKRMREKNECITKNSATRRLQNLNQALGRSKIPPQAQTLPNKKTGQW